ncbi:hypothetical protein [Bacillus canaveralius]|uniref:hypothetical protein n=1 Tax=Bacillus canaveralius TaxID=1403243 RepID=UPI000F786C1F|nr:hypothetical protein [Bacillus canaveralius]RSK55197.1 hypothetical protein EJA13_03940 [Bacillus canaveralius]
MTNQYDVEEIVIAVLRRMESAKQKKQQLLVIAKDLQQHKEQIEELKSHWDVIERQPGSSDIPCSTCQAVFLDVNQDLLVKGALGIIDTPESLLFSKLMSQGFHVYFVPNNSLSWILKPHDNQTVNKKYMTQLLDYHQRLQDFAVHFYPLKSIIPEEKEQLSRSSDGKQFINFDEKLLTKEIIDRWKEDCIHVHRDTIITPLARDTAKEKDIKIIDGRG